MAFRHQYEFTFPFNLIFSNSELLEEFESEAEVRNLMPFVHRIEIEHRSHGVWQRGTFMLHVFQDMLETMEITEKFRNFYAVVDLLQYILVKYLRFEMAVTLTVKKLRGTLKYLLEVAKNYRPFRSIKVVFLINKIKDGLGCRRVSFLKLLSRKDFEFILDCFRRRRFHGWNVRESALLMTDLCMKRKHAAALLFYGFPYGYRKIYFRMRCTDLLSEWTRVRNISLRYLIRSTIKDNGNLRLQMAVEILVSIFDPTRTDTIPLIRSIWKSVPWPLISTAEMSDLLLPFHTGRDPKVKDICEEYAARNRVFVVPSTPRPRSLRDLAGVRVRQNLCDGRTLSEDTISRLDIPKLLKDDLRLESCRLPE